MYVPTIFTTSSKKGPRPKWTIYVNNFGILCRLPVAYNGLCRGLKYSLKVPYIILDYPNVAGFWYSLFGQFENIALCLNKKYLHQTFTEFLPDQYSHFDVSIR